jgi:TPR repeat protein
MRWPDSAQDSGAAQPQVPSVAPAPEPPRANASTPSAPTSALALAPASETIPERPARQRPPARSAEEIELLLKQGQDFVAAGDLATARIVLRRAAEAGVAAAALALGQTYDRKVLAKMGARGVVPDGDEARRWYETAQRLGSSEAAQRLERLARDE